MKDLKNEKIIYYIGMLNEKGIFYWDGDENFIENFSYSCPMDKENALHTFDKLFTNSNINFLFIKGIENEQQN